MSVIWLTEMPTSTRAESPAKSQVDLHRQFSASPVINLLSKRDLRATGMTNGDLIRTVHFVPEKGSTESPLNELACELGC